MPDSIRITLPFPPKELSPNARKHWGAKIQPKNAQRDAGYWEAHPHHGKLGMEYVALSIVFIPKDRRWRDLDNLLARSKQLLDGVAKGLGINDKQFRPITIDMGEPDKKHPRVEITICEAA